MHLRIKIKKKENYGISNLTKKIIINKKIHDKKLQKHKCKKTQKATHIFLPISVTILH